MNSRSLLEATDFFIFSWFSQILRIFGIFMKNQNFLIFAEKSGILCKNHTFSPDGENSSIPLGFSQFQAWIFMKIQLFAKFNNFTKNQLFH